LAPIISQLTEAPSDRASLTYHIARINHHARTSASV